MLSKVLKHYKKIDVQQAIIDGATDKEISGSYGGKGYTRRPDVLQYPTDVIEMVKKGVTSFHASEELWRNPLQIKTGSPRREMDDLRKGWDLVLDIDCTWLDYSKIAAHLLIQAIKYQGIKSVSCKFSGNHGFHIGVPFESFPENVLGIETRTLFPEGPRKIAEYLKEMIKEHLSREILEFDSLDVIMKKSGKPYEELVVDGKFDPFTILEVDTILISSRHLYRMAYSFNEKSGWVSLPLDPDKVKEFDVKDSYSENVVVNDFRFMDKRNIVLGEARDLIIKSYDFAAEQEQKKKKIAQDKKVFKVEKRNEEVDLEKFEIKIPEELFPPCIKKIFGGLEDGKKRAVFILINFLASCNWSYEDMEDYLERWNKQNKEPLREVYWRGQLRYAKTQNKKVLPPNCNNKMYYTDLQICCPDGICRGVKNPVNYAVRRMKSLIAIEKKKTKTKNKSENKKETSNKKKQDEDQETNTQEAPTDQETNNSEGLKDQDKSDESESLKNENVLTVDDESVDNSTSEDVTSDDLVESNDISKSSNQNGSVVNKNNIDNENDRAE